ncbi:hypothetical protein B4168_3005 [Anoxybacillus flavithermus]|nr:hypothetical protein B4168_3005 [Anoxybacillus flavithermus]OAO86294.1 hypothetical protein GT23_2187 [Parageobacillus thermoglucosidasius]
MLRVRSARNIFFHALSRFFALMFKKRIPPKKESGIFPSHKVYFYSQRQVKRHAGNGRRRCEALRFHHIGEEECHCCLVINSNHA